MSGLKSGLETPPTRGDFLKLMPLGFASLYPNYEIMLRWLWQARHISSEAGNR
ncbi:MAG: hypothetical protein OXM61_18820 [Candidatus Poribacteria bacterium]|nr:hypothetical protein [Candidatus Poribacteria bacterium]